MKNKFFFLSSYFIIIFAAIASASLIRYYFIESYRIPTDLMEPNLIPGDLIFVNKSAYDFRIPYFKKNKSLPQYSDIVIYRSQSESGLLFIKRVIGLPGDSIEVINGQVLLNENLLPFLPSNNNVCGVEEHPKKSYKICLDPPVLSLFEKVTLKENEIFVMGDKRSIKNDRPIWDVIQPPQLLGSAHIIWLSIHSQNKASGFFPEIRFNRLFKRIY